MIRVNGKVVAIETRDSQKGRKYRTIKMLSPDESDIHEVAVFDDKATFVKGEMVDIEVVGNTRCVFKSKLHTDVKGK